MPKGVGYGRGRSGGKLPSLSSMGSPRRGGGGVQRIISKVLPQAGGGRRPSMIKTPDTGPKPLRTPTNRGRRGR